ncbi:MAG: T9SS type A sorting domain-containing protein, partial [Mariniphaga sp.]|nr:T9SS type A sorting domain-containing protein [Mariniphaga sp.]
EGYEELLVDEDDIVAVDPLCFEGTDGSINVPMSAVSGGAGAYKFTLLEWVEGEWVAVEVYTEVATGEFTGLPAGTYAVLVEDSEDCPSYTTADIVLSDPAELTFTTEFWHFSCEDSNDGIITLNVSGGTGNYWYAINNQNAWVAFGNAVTTKTYIATEPGTFVVWVKDENGCIAEPDTITILEPEALDAEITVDNHVSCYGGSDGQISVVGSGGWGVSVFEFKINDGAWISATTISDLPAGDHILYVRDVYEYSEPYQALDCEYSVPFTIGSPDPITYDVVIEDISCKDGEDGTFTVTILSGGTPKIEIEEGEDEEEVEVDYGYHVRLTGSDYDEEAWTGADYTYTFEGLAHSHYTLYITDANGCELPAPMQPSPTEGPYTTRESWEVQEPATYLTLDAEWVQDATCYGAEDGQFLLHADGGTAPYTYWAGLSVEPDGHILVPEDPNVDTVEWQESNEFNVGAGTWVVWVQDANGCIVGGEYENGIPVNKWRVKVEQPDSIEWAFHTITVGEEEEEVVHYVQPSCFGEWDGQIHIWNNLESIVGGSGVYHAHVWGTSAAGEPVELMFDSIEAHATLPIYVLDGIPASDSTGLFVTITDTNGCESATDTIFIDQPEELVVELIKSEGSFTCSDAVEGWIEAVATGGTGAYQYQLLKNGVVHTAWQNIASAFLVQIGNEFTVEVRDAKMCEAEATIDIQQIADVVIADIENRSCFGMVFPKAVVTATAEPGRALFIRHQKVEGASSIGPWSEWEPLNEEEGEGTHVYTDVLTFGDDNESDGHYNFQVRDEEWCLSEVIFKTFVPVQNAVVMTYTVVEEEECSAVVEVTNITGGFGPYVVMVNDSVMTDMTFTLPRGTYVLTAMDSQMCTDEVTIEVVGEYVTREIEVETFIGYQTEFVDEEAGVDTMLAVGAYEYVYMFGECERTLNVEVVAVPMPLTIAEIQGEGAETAVPAEDVVVVTGTVTGVSAGEGFFMQDANAAWSGIWVEYADASDLEIGDGVEVVGSVSEVVSVTTLTAAEVTMVDAPLVVEAVVADSPSGAENEMWESVLVTVEGGRARPADPGNGEWSVYYEPTDDIIVNDWLYAFEPTDSTFYHVTGIVNARLEAFKLEPRMESDIIDLGATNTEIISGVEFKVYPNPFNDRITIENHNKLTRVLVTNIAGQRVIDLEYPTREIRTANLVSGVYVVSMFTEDGLAKTERIVKR